MSVETVVQTLYLEAPTTKSVDLESKYHEIKRRKHTKVREFLDRYIQPVEE